MTDPSKGLFAVIEGLLPDMPDQESSALAHEIVSEFVYYLRRRATELATLSLDDVSQERAIKAILRREFLAINSPLVARIVAHDVCLSLANELAVADV